MNEPIQIDDEFRSLIPPLTPDEYKQLEANCRKDGILDSLKVWHGVLVDGHNRYKIAEEWDLNYEICEIDLPNREAALLWIINHQLGERNLILYDRVKLEDKKKEILAEQAKRNKGGDRKSEEFQKSNPKKSWELNQKEKAEKRKSERKNETDFKIAKAAGTSEDTVRKVRTIEKEGNQEIINAVRSGEISINNGYQQVMREKTPPAPKPADQAYEAKQRHKEYEQKKSEGVVNIQDARQDKEDQKLMARELYKDLLSITTKTHWIGALNTAADFDALVSVIPPEKVDGMLDRIQKMMIVLEKLKGVLNESKIRR